MSTTENTPQDTPEAVTDDEATPTPQDDPQGPQDTPEGAEATGEEQDEQTPHREAAKYRTRLREVEGERDTLAEQVAALHRREVERVAGEHLANPAGLWAAGVQVESLLAKDGTPDPQLIREAAQGAAEQLGLARPRPANYVPNEGGNPRLTAKYDDMAGVIRG